ncbi:lysine--tRNA ligase [Georgenia sp. EYE_87]|uniref:lysine--tRNA ligase n=1 Tax=Georgenia sp. EYE_87 TaxID=2853448 RepID=UPI0035A85AE0|nr:lysine--tRNA ligase [Georgenia sp. EYE_87]
MTEQTEEKSAVTTGAEHDEQAHDAPEQVRVRTEKRQRLLDSGIDPYPVTLPVTTTIADVRARFGALEPGEETDHVVGVAGRVMYLRNTGKLCFATLQDGEGRQLQAMLSKAEVGEEALAAFKSDVDLGDHLFVRGRVIASRRGELSVFADSFQLAAKALRPLPKTYENEAGELVALSEEGRVRRRHLDLIMRPAAREMVRTRAAVVKSLRRTLDARDFVEIETPMLQVQPGGAAARPFVTHMNAYDMDLYMRIAPELFLKRAVVGGVDRVFEINRNFRNEGADSTHSPEFSMLEAYEAYGSYDTMAELTRTLVQQAALDAYGSTTVTLEDGTEYDLGGEWAELSLFESVSERLGEEITPTTPMETLLAHADRLELDVAPHYTHGKVVEELFEHLVGDSLHAPTFVRDFPVDTSPLTRAHRSKPGVVEKWDLYVRGFELATAYSELVDPVVQRERFAAQALAAAAGDPEAMVLDEDFLEAMEQGMPPAGGMGMGIDRLLMALTGRGIRETITFPLVKPR